MTELLKQTLQVTTIVQPIQLLLITVSNVLNIRILCSRALRSSPCTYYFLSHTIFNMIYIWLICPIQFLRGISISWNYTDYLCKIVFYILFLTPMQASFMLVLATFDRYCASSREKYLQRISNLKLAGVLIILTCIILAIYTLPMSFILKWDEANKLCTAAPTLANNIYVYSQICIVGIVLPMLLLVFGGLTVRNVKKRSTRLGALVIHANNRRTEAQLTRMLLVQICVHMVFIIPFSIFYSMNSLDPSTRTANIIALRYIAVMWQQFDYGSSFFLYILSGTIYRKEFLRIFKCQSLFNRLKLSA